MQSGLILSQQDIKKIIAEHFHVSEDKVILWYKSRTNQYQKKQTSDNGGKSPFFYFLGYTKTSKK